MTASRLPARLALIAAIVWAVAIASAFAQSSTQPQTGNWSAAAGYETFALRDIARTSQPVDASPVTWQGSGAIFGVQHERRRGHWLHRYQGSAAFIGNFSYRSPNRSTDLSNDDIYRTLDGRYELRRAMFRDRFLRGLEIDIGVQGLGSFTAFTHAVPVDLVRKARIVAAGPAVVAGARLRRWSRIGIDVDYVNGGLIGKFTTTHSGGDFERRRGGGGWLTDLLVVATFRLTPKAALAVRYFDSGSGFISSHQNYAISRRSVSVGVTHVR